MSGDLRPAAGASPRTALPVKPRAEPGVSGRSNKILPPETALACGAMIFLAWLLACGISSFNFFVIDDSYITYIYGRSLAEGHGLRYNPTDPGPTEGFSSLTLVLFSALFQNLGLDPLTATRCLGLLFFLSIPLVFGLAASRATGVPVAATILSASVAMIVFSFLPENPPHLSSGMETVIFGAVNSWAFAWAVWLIMRPEENGRLAAITGSALMCLLVVTRPEGLLLAVGYPAAVLIGRYRKTRREGIVKIPALVGVRLGAFVLLLFVGKYLYFGYLLPNPYYVKSNHAIFGSSGEFLPGLGDVAAFLEKRYIPVLLAALSVSLFLRSRSEDGRWRAAAALLPSTGVILLYSRSIHEVAYGYRYEYPHLFPLAGFFTLLVSILWLKSRRIFGALLLAALLSPLLWNHQATRDALAWARSPSSSATYWYKPGHPATPLTKAGLDLARTGLGREATILLSAAGEVPYYSRFFTIDWLGLNTNRLSGRLPLSVGEAWDYIDSFRPDVIFTVFPPATPGYTQRGRDPAFGSRIVQGILNGLGSQLPPHWKREKIEEMIYREMLYTRDRYVFGACYNISWAALVVYVRRDSPRRAVIEEALAASEWKDESTNLRPRYVNDPRLLGKES